MSDASEKVEDQKRLRSHEVASTVMKAVRWAYVEILSGKRWTLILHTRHILRQQQRLHTGACLAEGDTRQTHYCLHFPGDLKRIIILKMFHMCSSKTLVAKPINQLDQPKQILTVLRISCTLCMCKHLRHYKHCRSRETQFRHLFVKWSSPSFLCPQIS